MATIQSFHKTTSCLTLLTMPPPGAHPIYCASQLELKLSEITKYTLLRNTKVNTIDQFRFDSNLDNMPR